MTTAVTPVTKRIASLQRHLNLRGDGFVGPVTVRRVEVELGVHAAARRLGPYIDAR